MVHERPCQNKNAIIHLVIWRGNYIIVKGKYHYKITTKEPKIVNLQDKLNWIESAKNGAVIKMVCIGFIQTK